VLSPAYTAPRIAAQFRILGAFVQQSAEQWNCGLGWRSTELLLGTVSTIPDHTVWGDNIKIPVSVHLNRHTGFVIHYFQAFNI